MAIIKNIKAWKIKFGEHEIIVTNRAKGIGVMVDGAAQDSDVKDALFSGNASVTVDGKEIIISVVSGMVDINLYAVTGDIIPFTYDDEKKAYTSKQDFLGHNIRIEETLLSKRKIFLDDEIITSTGVLVDNAMNPHTFTLEEKNVFLMPVLRENKGAVRHIDFVGVIGQRLNAVNGTFNTETSTFTAG